MILTYLELFQFLMVIGPIRIQRDAVRLDGPNAPATKWGFVEFFLEYDSVALLAIRTACKFTL
jgi:hypothetical protein